MSVILMSVNQEEKGEKFIFFFSCVPRFYNPLLWSLLWTRLLSKSLDTMDRPFS
jgi:hypothetical protein